MNKFNLFQRGFDVAYTGFQVGLLYARILRAKAMTQA